MSDPSIHSLTIHRWLDTLPADFDPLESRAPTLRQVEDFAPQATETGVRLDEAIGEGGMATVHSGLQISLDRIVAIKVKRTDLDPSTVDILHEAWLTSALEHPNIVPIYDLSLDEAGDPMVLMRRIEGTEWGKLFKTPEVVSRDYGASDVLEWHIRVFLQVCNAVHYAHSMGVIHRDIKPANVMVGKHGQVYLLDWGIAISRRGPLAAKLNKLGGDNEPVGTPCYLAPEMLSGDLESVDERTDIYLLAATLFHYLSGKPPHRGKSLEDVLNSAMNGPVVIPDDLPSEVRSILSRALARDPADRYATVDELRRAVDTYLSHRSSYRLEQHASEQLHTLQEALASRRLDNPQDRTELYRHYSTCRSAYRAALQLWDQNPRALESLQVATEAMIDAEIAFGTPRAASALLSDLEHPPEELVLRVSDAQHTEGQEHHDMRQMASLARKWSSEDGARLRVAMVLIVSLFYGGISIFAGDRSYIMSLGTDLIGLLGIVIYSGFMRRLQKFSAFNSRAVVILGIVLLVQLGRKLVALATDTPHDIFLMHDGLVFVTALSVSAASFEMRLWPACLGYAAAFVLAALDISLAGLGYGLAHILLGINTGWIWWPPRRSPQALSVSAPS